MKNIYHLHARKLNGEIFQFDSLQGKVVLVVNIASRCGMVGQLKGLQQIYETYQPQGFEIIAFPCSQFLF